MNNAYPIKDRVNGKKVQLVLNAPHSTFEGTRWAMAQQMVAFASRRRVIIKGGIVWASRTEGVSLSGQLEALVELNNEQPDRLPDQFDFIYPMANRVYRVVMSDGFVDAESVMKVDEAIVYIQSRFERGIPVYGQAGGSLTGDLETAGCLVKKDGLTVDPHSKAYRYQNLTLSLLKNKYPHWLIARAALLCLMLLAMPLAVWRYELIQGEQLVESLLLAKQFAAQSDNLNAEPLVSAQLPALVDALRHTDAWIANGLVAIKVSDGNLSLLGEITGSSALAKLVAMSSAYDVPLVLSEKGWLAGPFPLVFSIPPRLPPSDTNQVLSALYRVGERYGVRLLINARSSDALGREKTTVTFSGRYQSDFFTALATTLSSTPSQLDDVVLFPGAGTLATIKNLTISFWGIPNAKN